MQRDSRTGRALIDTRRGSSSHSPSTDPAEMLTPIAANTTNASALSEAGSLSPMISASPTPIPAEIARVRANCNTGRFEPASRDAFLATEAAEGLLVEGGSISLSYGETALMLPPYVTPSCAYDP